MNKKRIMFYLITAVVLIGSSSFVYASKNSRALTRNEVKSELVQADKTESCIGYIDDEDAIGIATKAMKDYFNIDSDYYSETIINRSDWNKDTEVIIEGQKYMVSKSFASFINKALDNNDIEGAKEDLKAALEDMPSEICVSFTPKEYNTEYPMINTVEIDADTREILYISAENNLERFKGEVDTNKIRESVISFFRSIDEEIDEDSIIRKEDMNYDYGEVIIDLKLIDGREVATVINLKDYSVIGYIKDYLRKPKEYLMKKYLK